MKKFIIRSLPVILIILFSLFALRETFNMYFTGDDFGFIYRLKVNGYYPWPNQHIVNMFRPLYLLFGPYPTGYFAVGFLFFVLSAISFYYLSRLIFSNKLHALVAALVYTIAPIGIESVTMALLYLGSYYALTLLNLALIFIIKFFRTGRKLFYVLALAVLLFAFETISFRAFLFPIVIFFFGIFFWNRKIFGVKKLLISFGIVAFLWALIYLLRVYFVDIQEGKYIILNLNPDFVRCQINAYISRLRHSFLGNIYYDNMDSAFIDAIRTSPIRLLSPLISMTNIIFTLTVINLTPIIHVPLLLITILFSGLIVLKRKIAGKDNVVRYFSSLAFIFAVVLAFYIPFPKNIMPINNHYSTYAMPGYALFITSSFLILRNLFKKNKSRFLKAFPYLFLISIVLINLSIINKYLSTYNQRINYVRPFFKQLKELMPTIPIDNPIIYIQPVVHPEDDPAEARWRLYDTWKGGIMGGNAVFGLYYENVDANKTLATPVWETVIEFVIENPQEDIDRVFSFDYDLDGLHMTTEKTREKLRSLLLESN